MRIMEAFDCGKSYIHGRDSLSQKKTRLVLCYLDIWWNVIYIPNPFFWLIT